MSEYESIVDCEITHKLLTACYAQHGDPRAHEQFAEGQSNCTSFILLSDGHDFADAVDLFLVIRMEGTS